MARTYEHDRSILALASKLGLQLPGMIDPDVALEVIAAEIRRRKWRIALDVPEHNLSAYSQGCRCLLCVRAHRRANGVEDNVRELPLFDRRQANGGRRIHSRRPK